MVEEDAHLILGDLRRHTSSQAGKVREHLRSTCCFNLFDECNSLCVGHRASNGRNRPIVPPGERERSGLFLGQDLLSVPAQSVATRGTESGQSARRPPAMRCPPAYSTARSGAAGSLAASPPVSSAIFSGDFLTLSPQAILWFAFPSSQHALQNGPEPSRARLYLARRSEPLTARTVLRGSGMRERRSAIRETSRRII